MEQHERGGGDRADSPGTQADPALRLEGGLEQGVPAFGESAGCEVRHFSGALIDSEGLAAGLAQLLDRADKPVGFALVACGVSERGQVLLQPSEMADS